MFINIQLTEQDLKALVIKELQTRLGEMPLDVMNVSIEVKSKQNYKSEWETAAFRATLKQEVV